MADVQLTKNDNGVYDISFDIDGNPILVYGLDEVIQNITTNILLVKGEWFLNVNEGVDYYGVVFVKGSTRLQIDSEFIRAIENTQSVNSIREYTSSFEGATRTLTIRFSADTTLGDTGTVEVSRSV